MEQLQMPDRLCRMLTRS